MFEGSRILLVAAKELANVDKCDRWTVFESGTATSSRAAAMAAPVYAGKDCKAAYFNLREQIAEAFAHECSLLLAAAEIQLSDDAATRFALPTSSPVCSCFLVDAVSDPKFQQNEEKMLTIITGNQVAIDCYLDADLRACCTALSNWFRKPTTGMRMFLLCDKIRVRSRMKDASLDVAKPARLLQSEIISDQEITLLLQWISNANKVLAKASKV